GDTDEDIDAYLEVVADVDQDFVELRQSSGLNEETGDLLTGEKLWRQAEAAVLSAVAAKPSQGMEEAAALQAFVTALHGSLAALGQATETSKVELAAEVAASDRRRRLTSLALTLIALLSVGIVIVLGRGLTRSIAVPVAALQNGAQRFGRGELEHRIVVPRNDELGELAGALNGMAAELTAGRHELERSQQHLVQAQKLEAVGQLAGGIAHDFNNLLLVVGSYADFLHESFDDDDPRRDDAAQIRQASDRAAALTRQLLTFSRRDVTQPVPLDVAAAIARLEEMLRRTLTATIDLRLELEPDLRATVIDPGQLEQIMLNLVLNARNAMPGGGTLTIRANAVAVGESRPVPGVAPGSYVAVAVSDTGQGMSEEVRSRALEPFFTTRADTGGSGLGLATVYGIIAGAGGAITVASKPGEGTTIVLYLPTTDESVEASGAAEPTSRSERRHHTVVLLAEDEPTIRRLATRILSTQGYTVLAAATGADALEIARATERIDVLLTDVIMPGMTGGELAATLARERPGLPTVYMSGYSDQIVAQHGVLDANTLYLQKPFRPQELLELLEQTLAPAPAA
ncbi:MAG TPA: response regulator, partial [Gaiellaceae bacterium]|nr:response regulator [Gaiellaceae bacterium]